LSDGQILPVGSATSKLLLIQEYFDLDKRALFTKTFKNLLYWSFLSKNSTELDADNELFLPKIDLSKYYQIEDFLKLFCTTIRKDGYNPLEISLHDFLLLNTMFRDPTLFKSLSKVFDLEFIDENQAPFVAYKLNDLFSVLKVDTKGHTQTSAISSDGKSSNHTITSVHPNPTPTDSGSNLIANQKTLLLTYPDCFNYNNLELFDKLTPEIAKFDKYSNVIFSDGKLPGKVIMINQNKFLRCHVAYLDIHIDPDTKEIDLTGKLNDANFVLATSPTDIDKQNLFFLAESFILEDSEFIKKLQTDYELTQTGVITDIEDSKCIKKFLARFALDSSKNIYTLNDYLNFTLICSQGLMDNSLKLNELLNHITFKKEAERIVCAAKSEDYYNILLDVIKNKKVVQAISQEHNINIVDDFKFYSRKLISIKEMSEKSKLDVISRMNVILSNKENTRTNQELQNILNQILSIPYGKYAKDNDINEVISYLDENLYGMQYTKNQIKKFLAKHKLNGKATPKTICLLGNPGVGKTYFCQELAKALNRPVFKIGIGSLDSKAMLMGSTPVYSGSDSGYIVKSLIQNQVMNPIIILDEIDKISGSYAGSNGGLQSALIEILDPIQNASVRDNYLQVEVDLSKIWFIATANNLKSISPPLVDRMEVIEIKDYSLKDKLQIFDKILWERYSSDAGLTEYKYTWDEDAKETFISSVSEAGIRSLAKKIDSLCGSLALEIVENKLEKVNTLLDKARIDKWESEWENHMSKNKIGFEVD